MSNGMFDPTEQELAEDNEMQRLNSLGYGHVTIPSEVKGAWRDVQEAERVLAKLKSYPRMNANMKLKADYSARMLRRGRVILSRFFITVQAGPQHLTKDSTWA